MHTIKNYTFTRCYIFTLCYIFLNFGVGCVWPKSLQNENKIQWQDWNWTKTMKVLIKENRYVTFSPARVYREQRRAQRRPRRVCVGELCRLEAAVNSPSPSVHPKPGQRYREVRASCSLETRKQWGRIKLQRFFTPLLESEGWVRWSSSLLEQKGAKVRIGRVALFCFDSLTPSSSVLCSLSPAAAKTFY